MRWVRDLIRRERYRVDRACSSVIRIAGDATATRSHFIRLSSGWAVHDEELSEAEVGVVGRYPSKRQGYGAELN